MIKYGVMSLFGMFIAGWLIVTIWYLWDLSRPTDLIVLILSCVLLITQSFIVWFKLAVGK